MHTAIHVTDRPGRQSLYNSNTRIGTGIDTGHGAHTASTANITLILYGNIFVRGNIANNNYNIALEFLEGYGTHVIRRI